VNSYKDGDVDREIWQLVLIQFPRKAIGDSLHFHVNSASRLIY